MTPLTQKASWPQVRAGLIAIVLAVSGLLAAPLPTPVTEKDFTTPVSSQEIDLWHDLSQQVGLTWTRDEFIGVIMVMSNGIGESHRAFKRPVSNVLSITQTGQGWALFAVPDAYPHTLIVEGQVTKGGKWRTLYRRWDPDYGEVFLADAFEYRRIRGIYDGSTHRAGRTYKNFTRWVAERAFADWPELQTVRVGMIRSHTTLPGEPKDTKTVYRQKRVWHRDKM